MEFKKDFKIKPKEVNPNGLVEFTDGTNDVVPNQLACEAYGYKYDTQTGTCMSFIPTSKLDTQLKEPSNTIKGVSNTTNKGTSRSIINGTLNTTKGFNENCLVSGNNNTINNGINNATIIGEYGRGIRQGEFVVGGGGNGGRNTDNVPQFSVVQLSTSTTDNTPANLTVNGISNEYINLQNNSILGFEAFITRLEVGGSSGTIGNFSYRHMKGVVRVENNHDTTITTFNSRIIGKLGSNGTVSVVDVATGTLSLQVTGANNVNNSWSAVVYLHELKTNATIE